MPLCQSAVVAFFASEGTKILADAYTDWDESQKQLARAGVTALAGGTTAVATVDPVGGGIVAAQTAYHLLCAIMGYEPEGAPPPIFEH